MSRTATTLIRVGSPWRAKLDAGSSLVPVDVIGVDGPTVEQEQHHGTTIEINLPCGTTLRCNGLERVSVIPITSAWSDIAYG
jgi:hypothetical protein